MRKENGAACGNVSVDKEGTSFNSEGGWQRTGRVNDPLFGSIYISYKPSSEKQTSKRSAWITGHRMRRKGREKRAKTKTRARDGKKGKCQGALEGLETWMASTSVVEGLERAHAANHRQTEKPMATAA